MHKPVKRTKTSHRIIKQVVKPFQGKERNTHFLVLIVVIVLSLFYLSIFRSGELTLTQKDISGKGYFGALQCAQVGCDYKVTDQWNKDQLVSLSEGSSTNLKTTDHTLDVTLGGKGDLPDSCKTHFRWCNLNNGNCIEETKHMTQGETAVYSYGMSVTLEQGYCFQPIIPPCLSDNDCTDGKICEITSGNCIISPPETKGTIAYWQFNEGQGNTVQDQSGFGNNGELFEALWFQNKGGYGLDFDGANDFVKTNIKYDTSKGTGISVGVWYKTEDGSTSKMTLVGGNNGGRFEVYLNQGMPGCRVWDTGEKSIYIDEQFIGNWHHIVCTQMFNPEQTALYVDGVLKKTASAASVSAGGNWYLGKPGSTGAAYYHGSLDEVKLFDTHLTSEQVLNLYNEGKNNVQSVQVNEQDPHPLKGEFYIGNENIQAKKTGAGVLYLFVTDSDGIEKVHLPDVPEDLIVNEGCESEFSCEWVYDFETESGKKLFEKMCYNGCTAEDISIEITDKKGNMYSYILNRNNNFYYNTETEGNVLADASHYFSQCSCEVFLGDTVCVQPCSKGEICSRGQCINVQKFQPPIKSICSDSDSTSKNDPFKTEVILSTDEIKYINYGTQGTVSHGTQSFTDACITQGSTTYLNEYFCDLKTNTPGKFLVVCPDGTRCDKLKGACVPTLPLTPDGDKKELVDLCTALSIPCPAGSSCFSGNCYKTDDRGNIGDGSCLEKCPSATVCLRQICLGMNKLPQGITKQLEKNKVDLCKDITCQANEACFKGACVNKNPDGNIGDSDCVSKCQEGFICLNTKCKDPNDPTIDPKEISDLLTDIKEDQQEDDDQDTEEKDLCALLPKPCPSGSSCLQGNCYTVDEKGNIGDTDCKVTCESGFVCIKGSCQNPQDGKVDIDTLLDDLKDNKVDPCKNIVCQDNQACLQGVCLTKDAKGNIGDGSCTIKCETNELCINKACKKTDDPALDPENVLDLLNDIIEAETEKDLCTLLPKPCPTGSSCLLGNCYSVDEKGNIGDANCAEKCASGFVCNNGKCTEANDPAINLKDILEDNVVDLCKAVICNENQGCFKGACVNKNPDGNIGDSDCAIKCKEGFICLNTKCKDPNDPAIDPKEISEILTDIKEDQQKDDDQDTEEKDLCTLLPKPCPTGSSCLLGNCYSVDEKGNIGDVNCAEKCTSGFVCVKGSCQNPQDAKVDIDTLLDDLKNNKVDLCKNIVCQDNQACLQGVCLTKDAKGNIGDGSCTIKCETNELCINKACKKTDDPALDPENVLDLLNDIIEAETEKELCALLPKPCPTGSSCLLGNCYTVDGKGNMGDGSCTVTCDTGFICTNKKCQDPDDLLIDIKDILKDSKVDLCKDIKCQDNQSCLKGVCLNKNKDGSLGDGSCAKVCPADSICLAKECVLGDDIMISALNISQNQSQQPDSKKDQQDSGDSKKGGKKLYSKLYKGNIFDKDTSSTKTTSTFSITKIEKKKQKKPQTIKIGTVKSPVKQDIKPQVKQSSPTVKTQEKAVEPTCSDGIKNQDETDIDCGGSCIACKEKGKLLRWWVWALLAVGLFGILVLIGEAKIYHLFSRTKTSSGFSSKQVPQTTIVPKTEGALAFMKEQLNKGIPKDQIIDNMLAAGWEDEFVTKLFEEHFAELVSQKDKEQVAKFIAYYRKKGMPEEDIKETLKDTGWDEGLLDALLKK